MGRVGARVVDATRPDERSPQGGLGTLPLTVWYPAMAGSGTATTYLAGYDTLRSGLEASGELNSVEVAGLSLARTNAKVDATLDPRTSAYPVGVGHLEA